MKENYLRGVRKTINSGENARTNKAATEKSEEEILFFLEKYFGVKDIEPNPEVGTKQADFRVKSIDTYVEVYALKNIKNDQFDVLFEEEHAGRIITARNLKDNGQKKILDRIARKLLHECGHLPEGKKNLIVTKTEGVSLLPEDVIDSIIGEPYLLINTKNNKESVEHRATAFRTKEELLQVLQKVSAVFAYKSVCQHGKLSGIIGNNKSKAQVPFDDKTISIFQSFLCDKCYA
jgi:hypothetical protein